MQKGAEALGFVMQQNDSGQSPAEQARWRDLEALLRAVSIACEQVGLNHIKHLQWSKLG